MLDTIPPALDRFTVSGDDVDLARRTYQKAYGGIRFAVSRSSGDVAGAGAGNAPGDFSFRYAHVGDDRVMLRTSTLTGQLSGEIPHLREYVVSWFRSGSGELRRHQVARTGVVSEPFLFPAEQHFAFTFAPHRQQLVAFSTPFLENIATEFHAGPPQAVAFDHDAHPAADAVARWRTAVSQATAVLLDAAAPPLLRMNAQRPLARALLQLFPWFGLDIPPLLREPPLARMRAALEYLHHHAHEPITPADAARAAGMHTRTFQQQAKTHLGLSPSAFLRGVRLDRAHRDLLESSPESRSVALIARHWGFGHLGRFSAAYQARFGQRPSDTLRF
ncbi:AraC family transcriptional regulator [Subtercola sp. Z020]|uniref:AraC family transcriptional regulator n=1 Tax=Subtercola sp. Z020 TaxID=2080582 RepID=UPI000CE8FFD0|nr:helix-turn-helix domain-containing protein [Subtercola sp. Z020]PPF76795.1 AraC family transcriptional regulator [Subtercola sp. Z020]